MTKYRKLHTQIPESPDFTEMPDDFVRVTWVLLMLVLDRNGRGVDSARAMQSKLYPTREDVTLEQVQYALDYFSDHGLITRYQVNGRRYFYQTNFEKYQGDTRKEAASIYPDPIQESQEIIDEPTPELRESKSGVGQELRESGSGTDAYADAHANTDSKADANADSTAGGVTTDIYRTMEDLLGLSESNRNRLVDDIAEYGQPEVVYALNEAFLHNAHNWKYIETILENRKNGVSPPRNNGHGKPIQAPQRVTNIGERYA